MAARAIRWLLALVTLLGVGTAAQAVPIAYTVTGSFSFTSGIGSTGGPVALAGGTIVLDLDPVGGTATFVSGSLDFGTFSFTDTLFIWTATTTATGVVHTLSAGGTGTLDPVAGTVAFTGASQLSGAAPTGTESCTGNALACLFAPTALDAVQPFDATFQFTPGWAGFTLNASWTDAGGGTTTLSLSGVPEPDTFALLGTGILGLAFYGRRRRA